jgi:hypothetical protein
MKKVSHLIRVGALMSAKYASIDANTIKDRVQNTLKTALANASTAKLGIMPFMQMLQADQSAMNINVTRSGDTITVSPPSLEKPELSAKYAALPGQIKDYLEKYLEVYPSKLNGEQVDYHNLTCTLEFNPAPATPAEGIANL